MYPKSRQSIPKGKQLLKNINDYSCDGGGTD
jgi:hypothetical protein